MFVENVLNMLVLDEEQREAFSHVLKDHHQVFAPDGRMLGTDTPVALDTYQNATIILGNPPVEYIRGNRQLRLLHTRSAGVDRYLEPGILPEGALLAGCSGAWGPAMAEHVFAMLLALMKRLPAYHDQQKMCAWKKLGREKTLIGARVLCVGTGDLGASFAKLCKAFGAHTVGIRREPEKSVESIDEMYGLGSLEEQIPMADVVCLMLPHTRDTVHLMDSRRLRMMKSDAILLNGGRGTAIDCQALAEVLGTGHLWGAGLDVTAPEPLPPEHPLWKQERVLLTPHTAGGLIDDTLQRIADIILENLKHYFLGETLRNQFVR